LERQFKEPKHGEFWVPGTSNDPIFGILGLPENYFELRFGSRHRLKSDVIHGVLENGDKVTLWTRDFPQYSLSEHAPENFSEARSVSHILVGVHCDSKDEVFINKIAIGFDHLRAWLRMDEVISTSDERPDRQPFSIAAPYNIDSTLEITLGDRPVLESFADSTGSYDAWGRFWGNNATIEISSDRALCYSEWAKIEHSLMRLIAFNYGLKLPINLRNYFLSARDEPLDIFSISPMRPPAQRGYISETELVIPGTEMPPEVTIDNWFRALSELYPVPQILAGKEFQRNSILESNVLSAIAALEKMHEHMGFAQERFPVEDFELLRSRLVELVSKDEQQSTLAIPSREWRDFLERAIGNRRSLRSKLKDLVRRLGKETFSNLGITPDEWINNVVEIRNRIAHTGSHVSEPSDNEAVRLRKLEGQTRAVLKLLLRVWMGLEVPNQKRLSLMFRPLFQKE